MADYKNLSITGDLRRVFETATLVSASFDDLKTRTAYIVLGAIDLQNSTINNYFRENGLVLSAPMTIKGLLKTPETFASVFGEKAAKNLFDFSEVLGKLDDEKQANEKEKQEENKELPMNKKDLELKIKEILIQNEMDRQREIQEEEYEPDIKVTYSDKLEDALNDAAQRCVNSNNKCLDVDNLLYSILANNESSGYKIINYLVEGLDEAIPGCKVCAEDFLLYMEQHCNIYVATDDEHIAIPLSLESCCEVFNPKFTKGEKSEILGRDREKEQLWNIFSKKTKSNAILVGEPGVGKTAIMEAITQDIVNEECPERFIGYTVISFNIEASVAGTTYRGQFEAKVEMLKKFIENTPKIVLFIDEIHRTVGAGSTDRGSNDLSGALKSTLARDDVIVVGTTTIDEYEFFIKSDKAFKRRFEKVFVKEPKNHEVKAMVKKKIETLEAYHGVKLEEGLIDYIITASSCFNLEASNPDNTLDLSDRAMAAAELSKDKIVTREHIKQVFADSYEKLYSMDEHKKELIAYHEAAHYVVDKVTSSEKEKEIIAISIIPAYDFLGANILESKEGIFLRDKKYFVDEIKSLLAGREIERIKFGQIDSGAHSDLIKATKIAKALVMNYGIDANYENISFSYDTSDECNILYTSEKVKDEINGKVKIIISDATRECRKVLEDSMGFVDSVAKALIDNSLLTKEDLDKLYREYISSDKDL